MTTPSPIPNKDGVFNEDDYINPSLTKSEADSYYISLNKLITVNDGLALNSNIIADGKTIQPGKVGYINNLSSDVQQQINNISSGGTNTVGNIVPINLAISNGDNINQFANKTQGQINNLLSSTPQNMVDLNSVQTLTNKTLTTPKIVSLKTTSNNILNMPDINDTIATNQQITTLSNSITTTNDNLFNLNSKVDNLPVSFGSGEVSYLNNTTTIINGITYFTLTKSPPNGTQQLLQKTIKDVSGNVLLGSFITDYTIGKNFIDAGIYEFNLFASLSDLADTTKIYCIVSKLNSSFVKTTLFTLNNSLDIQSLPIILYSFQGTQPQIITNIDDKIIVDFYCNTTHNQNITVSLYYNNSIYFSHLHIPLITTHDQLTGLNTGEYQHLTNTQKNNIINESSINQNGYLSSTNFTIFNNKQNLISQNTAFNKNYENSTTNIKMNNIVSVGILDTIARSDHIHPIDTSREPTITIGTVGQYFRGDKTFQTLDKSTVGLSNVDNTTDLNKPISTATQTALNLKQNSITTGTSTQYIKGDLTLGTFNTQARNGVIYVNGLTGSDANDGLSLLTAYQTINAALLNQYISSGYQLQINPATYNENIIINSQNLTIISVNGPELGGLCNIVGNFTISATSSSVRLIGLTINGNIIHSGACNLYIQNLNCNGNFTKTGNGYLSINNMICNITSQLTISGSGNCNIINGSNLGMSLTINNSGAIVVIQNCLSMANLILQAGICSIFQTVIYGKSSAPSFNCCTITGTASALYLNNCDLVDVVNSSPYIISVAINNFYSLRNVNMNFTGSTLNGTNIGRTLYFDNIASNGVDLVNLNSNQTLTNKSLTTPIITNNILKSGTSKFITLIDSSDTLVNLNSNQNMTNKSFSALKLTDNFIKTSTNNTITFLDTNDTIVNLLSNQTITNKNMTNLTLGDDYFKTSLNRVVNVPNSNDTLVNLNSIQTMTNKTLTAPNINSGVLDTNTTAITQLSTDNSTKIATTAFVKLFSAPFIYKSVKTTAPYTFNFGANLQFNMVFESSSGSASNDLYMFVDNTSSATFNISITSLLYYSSSPGSTYQITSNQSILKTSSYTQLSIGGVKTNDNRGVKGDIFDWSNNINYRFTVLYKNSSNVSYIIEQITL